jgi:fructose/tagatose bisphosphate aldolase
MFDGSDLPLKENLEISRRYLERLSRIDMILEIETGGGGGEEDGHDTSGGDKKVYDPRFYMKKGVAGMRDRVVRACADLQSTETSLLAGT